MQASQTLECVRRFPYVLGLLVCRGLRQCMGGPYRAGPHLPLLCQETLILSGMVSPAHTFKIRASIPECHEGAYDGNVRSCLCTPCAHLRLSYSFREDGEQGPGQSTAYLAHCGNTNSILQFTLTQSLSWRYTAPSPIILRNAGD